MRDAIKRRKVSEVEGGEKVRIRSKSLREPSFGLGQGTGKRDYVLPGNKDYSVGDVIRKPEGGGGGSGSKGSPDGEGEDDFVFQLTREEFLDLFFEDLKLPNLVKAKLKSLTSPERRASRPDERRLALETQQAAHHAQQSGAAHRAAAAKRCRNWKTWKQLIAALEAEDPRDEGRIEELKKRLQHMNLLRKVVAYIDPLDLRTTAIERVPRSRRRRR